VTRHSTYIGELENTIEVDKELRKFSVASTNSSQIFSEQQCKYFPLHQIICV